MDKLESSYSKFIKEYEPYKVACTQCSKLYVSSSDKPFVCLECSSDPNTAGYSTGKWSDDDDMHPTITPLFGPNR